MSQKTNISVTVALLVATAAFCGCGKSEPPAGSTASQQPASPPAVPAFAPAASAPASASAPAAQPAASSSTPVPVDGDLPGVRIAVNELRRTSTTLTLKFTLYNTSDKAFGTQGVFDGDEYHRFRNLAALHLLDAEAKKKYFVVTDTDGHFLASNDFPDIAPKSQITLWAKFPAPPNEVRKMTVEIPHFIPIEDVAIVQ